MQTKFKERTKELLQEEYDAFEKALNAQPPVSIRFNPYKLDIPLSQWINDSDLQPINIDSCKLAIDIQEAIPWCKTGFFLSKRPSFTFDPLFHAGTYYVQEAASMFIEQAVLKIITESAEVSGFTREEQTSVQKPVTVLDLCAAPGGKSTLMQSLLPADSLLVSNEVIRSRSMILAENMAKWGAPNNIVTSNDPKDIGRLTHVFDIILADLPCSGEGMFRKDTASRDEWSVDNVKLCAARQRRIIHDVWNALKPGGWLIYSTCTFNTEENEENICALATEFGAEITPVPVKEEWNITGSLSNNIPVYRFFPHRTKGEGFFLALMRKDSGTAEDSRTKSKLQNNKPAISEDVKKMILNPERFTFYATKNIFAIPSIYDDLYKTISGQLNIISAGITLGEYKGHDFVPSISLALSTEVNTEAFPTVELPNEQAIKYLQREAIILPVDTPKGHVIVTFGNKPLGFVKNIGNRANNLYPQEWRIRSRK